LKLLCTYSLSICAFIALCFSDLFTIMFILISIFPSSKFVDLLDMPEQAFA